MGFEERSEPSDPRREGWLAKKGRSERTGALVWKRRWFALDCQGLRWWEDEGRKGAAIGFIPLGSIACARAAPEKSAARFIVLCRSENTSQHEQRYDFESETPADLRRWLDVINHQIELITRLSSPAAENVIEISGATDRSTSELQQPRAFGNETRHSPPQPMKDLLRENGQEWRGLANAGRRILSSEETVKRIRAIPGNDTCADCVTSDPHRFQALADWASLGRGVVVCIRCCGAHRRVATHNTKVLSVRDDRWTEDQVEQMELHGNILVNAELEAALPQGTKPDLATCDAEDLEAYVYAKYVLRSFQRGGDNVIPSVKVKSGHAMGAPNYIAILFLKLISGSHIPNMDGFSKTEAHCDFILGDRKIKSKPCGVRCQSPCPLALQPKMIVSSPRVVDHASPHFPRAGIQ
mmetsp:Transcript_29559/g.80726  ORF Transcript_29559/g.80726 Transcript_29559/m.80726 type:complete len:410 (+) Transcript_29559:63-1292(+)